MAKNARQKRTAKRKLALSLLAHARNPPMVASKGLVRSAWSKTLPAGSARIPYHGSPAPADHSRKRWSLDGFPKK